MSKPTNPDNQLLEYTLAGGAHIALSFPYPLSLQTIEHLERIVGTLKREAQEQNARTKGRMLLSSAPNESSEENVFDERETHWDYQMGETP